MLPAQRSVVEWFRSITWRLLVIVLISSQNLELSAQQSDSGQDDVSTLPHFLRYDTGGVDNITKGIQFSPDSSTLYVAGWNKLIQVYRREQTSGRYEYAPLENFRVPIGRGRHGMLECLAVSPDGRWLAAAGEIGLPDESPLPAWVWPRAETPARFLEESGAIYVFDTQTRRCRVLRGHRGTVRQLQFADGEAESDTLVSVGLETRGDASSQMVRVWSVAEAQQLADPLSVPRSVLQNGVELPARVRAWNAAEKNPIVAVASWSLQSGAFQPSLQLWRPVTGDRTRVIHNAPVTFALELFRSGTDQRLYGGGLGHDTIYRLNGATVAGRTVSGAALREQTPFVATRFPSAASQSGAVRALAVCIQPLPDGELEYSLHRVTDAGRSRVGRLWRNTPRPEFSHALLIEPKIAVARDQKTVAVAGAADNSVWLLNTESVTARQNPAAQLRPKQVLRNATLVAQSAFFVSNGEQSGIAVDDWVPPSDAAAGSRLVPDGPRVLNATTGRITEQAPDWQKSAAPAGGWTGRIVADQQQVEVSNRTDGTQRQLALPPEIRAPGVRYEITAIALCDALHGNPPLAAVAMHLQGDPLLCIFDMSSGHLLRMFEGHTRRIQSLSFSGDGALLLSASLDGTVNGWLVQDLAEKTVGGVGRLPGLIVAGEDGTVEVVRRDGHSETDGPDLRVGDVIEGVESEFGFEPFHSAQDFYQFVSQTGPQLTPQLTLRRRRGDEHRAVSVAVSQGADFRWPLFSLLLAPAPEDEPAADLSWLVWTPDGRFDRADQTLSGQLGWHINTGQDVRPVSYSSVEQYAARFRQQHLLPALLGPSHAARNEPIVPEMRVSVVSDSGQVIEPDYDDEIVLSEFSGRLVAEFNTGAGERIASANWTFADGQPLDLERVGRDLWATDLSIEENGRGPHVVVVTATAKDDPALILRQQMLVRYQPAAPQLTLVSPERSLTTVDREAAVIRFRADVAVPATVTLRHSADDRVLQETQISVTESGEHEQTVNLVPGLNRLHLVGVNDGIPDSLSRFRENEQMQVELDINFVPPGPPVIFLSQLRSSETQAPIPMQEGRFLTDTAQLMLNGTIQSDGELSQAGIRRTDTAPVEVLTGFEPDTVANVEFREAVALEPGEQTIVLSAAAGSQSTELRVPVLFRPPLPALNLVQPETRQIRQIAADDTTTPFAVRLAGDPMYPFRMALLVDGEPVSEPALQYDPTTLTLSGNVALRGDAARHPDSHVLTIALENEWGVRSATSFVTELRHPPELMDLQLSRDEGSTAADLVCAARVAPSRPITHVQVRVNDQTLSDFPFEVDVAAPDSATVRLSRLPLQFGLNRIEVRLENSDGESAPLSIEEEVVRVSLPPAVKLAEPLTDLTTMLPTQQLSFRVYSEPGLQRVDVVVRPDRRSPRRISLWPRGQESEQNLARTFTYRLPLAAGLNEVEVIVQNRGGTVRRRLSLTYLPPPVRLDLDQVIAIDDSWKVDAATDDTGMIRFPEAARDGNAVLQGSIGWLPGHRPHGDLWTVRVWVNGFLRSLQIPAPEAAAESVTFAVPVVLNQSQNRMRIESPEISYTDERLAMADNSIPRFRQVSVACDQPERRQRLHLVMMGVQIEDGANVASAEELQTFASAALQLEAQASAFEQVRRYAPLVGENAVGRRLRSLMSLVSADVSRRTGRSQINDVVMFYYQGREHWNDDGQFILEDFQNFDNPVQHSQSVSEEYLAELFRDLPGAHVVFLDVQNADRRQLSTSRWPQFPNLGLFRIAWSGRAPDPLPPGPLFSTVRDATGDAEAEGVLRLRRLESAFHAQMGIDAADGRFRVETYVPEDLAELIVARFTAAVGAPGSN